MSNTAEEHIAELQEQIRKLIEEHGWGIKSNQWFPARSFLPDLVRGQSGYITCWVSKPVLCCDDAGSMHVARCYMQGNLIVWQTDNGNVVHPVAWKVLPNVYKERKCNNWKSP